MERLREDVAALERREQERRRRQAEAQRAGRRPSAGSVYSVSLADSGSSPRPSAAGQHRTGGVSGLQRADGAIKASQQSLAPK